jgi:hypothetical protein
VSQSELHRQTELPGVVSVDLVMMNPPLVQYSGKIGSSMGHTLAIYGYEQILYYNENKGVA